jgi:hypothetical protein
MKSTPSCPAWGDAMKRFRLSTLMLLIVIAALGIALVMQHRRAARREAELQARLNGAESKVFMLEQRNLVKQWQTLSESRRRSKRQPVASTEMEKGIDCE